MTRDTYQGRSHVSMIRNTHVTDISVHYVFSKKEWMSRVHAYHSFYARLVNHSEAQINTNTGTSPIDRTTYGGTILATALRSTTGLG